MSNQTQKLINAIKDNKSQVIQATFESIMAEKTRAVIDARREVVANSIFNKETSK